MLLIISAVLMIAEKGRNTVVIGLLALFVLMLIVSEVMGYRLTLSPADAAAAALGASSVRLASQDAKMA